MNGDEELTFLFVGPTGEVTTMEMVRFHAADDYDITNKNTADYLGDTTFLCTGIDSQNKNQVISLYDVSLSSVSLWPLSLALAS